MMFALPAENYEVDPVVASALDKLLILHADHEQNCSTSTVRIVGSSKASIYSSISAGINALWGPLHEGANQEVILMLDQIMKDGGDTDKWIAKAKDKNDPFRLMGFGHRGYKNFDPRAKIIKKAADDVLEKLGVNDPTLEIAMKLEEVALRDSYFIERKLYPNVDFYSGIIYKAPKYSCRYVYCNACHWPFAGMDCTVERIAREQRTHWAPNARSIQARILGPMYL